MILSVSLLITACSAQHPAEVIPFEIVSAPEREHGYSNFESVAIKSAEELDAFLSDVGKQEGWNGREEFEAALRSAGTAFPGEALVLIRHTEASGSIKAAISSMTANAATLEVSISRDKPKFRTSDMAYYCFVLKVSRALFSDVLVRPEGKSPFMIEIN